jgi:hypothetical protein
MSIHNPDGTTEHYLSKPEVKITAVQVLGRDLKPGDLFSIAGPDYWRTALDKGSVGEQVYIRTNVPADKFVDADEPIYRITIGVE